MPAKIAFFLICFEIQHTQKTVDEKNIQAENELQLSWKKHKNEK